MKRKLKHYTKLLKEGKIELSDVQKGIYTVQILDIKGSLFLLKWKLLSKYESRTSVLVSSNAEYMDVLLITKVYIIYKSYR